MEKYQCHNIDVCYVELYKNIMYLQEKDIDQKRIVLTKLPKDKVRWY